MHRFTHYSQRLVGAQTAAPGGWDWRRWRLSLMIGVILVISGSGQLLGGMPLTEAIRVSENSGPFEPSASAEQRQTVEGRGHMDRTHSDNEADDGRKSTKASTRYSYKAPTLGGRYFWTDLAYHAGYRLQRHAWFEQYRVIDPQDRLEAWGSREKCWKQLEQVREREALAPIRGPVVILLHGLGRTHAAMNGLARWLQEQHPDWTVINWNYASTRAPVSQHAEDLATLIEHLPEAKSISFVGHSLGNIVVRHFLADQRRMGLRDEEHERQPADRISPAESTRLLSPVERAKETTRGPSATSTPRASDEATKPRLAAWERGRVVMLAPPNQGSRLAQFFRRNPLFHAVWGKSGKQLSTAWESLEQRLAIPACEFGIVAGGSDRRWASNPLLEGRDDLIVSVEETKLPGAADFLVVAASHTWIMDRPDVREAVDRFLMNGYFLTPDQRQALPEVSPQEDR